MEATIRPENVDESPSEYTDPPYRDEHQLRDPKRMIHNSTKIE